MCVHLCLWEITLWQSVHTQLSSQLQKFCLFSPQSCLWPRNLNVPLKSPLTKYEDQNLDPKWLNCSKTLSLEICNSFGSVHTKLRKNSPVRHYLFILSGRERRADLQLWIQVCPPVRSINKLSQDTQVWKARVKARLVCLCQDIFWHHFIISHSIKTIELKPNGNQICLLEAASQ